jgi:cation diffusion facilitator CzcD-associated flavoprotein CzcO
MPAAAAPSTAEPAESFRVIVLGAGMSGICAGIQLRKAGIQDFVILEKAEAVGGTWRENTYPGIACDVPSHVYSFSFELNPDWAHAYSSGAEIWSYCERCVAKYGLGPHIRFQTEVEGVRFDGGRWTVTMTDGTALHADAVVSGLGGLHLPKHPEIEGLENFAGQRFHTAEWNHEHDLAGRRVAMIGTGASGAQVLPEIARDVAQVSVFQRSAAWVFPRLAQEIPEEQRATYRRSAWRMRLHRMFLWLLMDVTGVLSLRRTGVFPKRLRNAGLRHLEDSVQDATTRQKLTPAYDPGCKRRVISDDYLSSFNRENVSLVTEGIARIEPEGIRDASGQLHEVDTIIEATGFRPFDITDYVRIEGRDGRRLRDVWADRVETFRTMMVPGFPNFFLLLGPNSATGHTSALIMIESQVKYVIECLELMEREGIAQLDPDPEVVARYNQRLQADLKKMVFSGGCGSWYTDHNDHNFTLWPYSAFRYCIEQWKPRRGEFREVAASK